jgi:hypothetical protein
MEVDLVHIVGHFQTFHPNTEQKSYQGMMWSQFDYPIVGVSKWARQLAETSIPVQRGSGKIPWFEGHNQSECGRYSQLNAAFCTPNQNRD